MIEALGILAGFFTTCAYLPQLLRILRTRDASAISSTMYSVMCLGMALWFAYGLLVHSIAVSLWNLVSLALAIPILVLKFRHATGR